MAKSIRDLIETLSQANQRLEKGELHLSELNELTDHAREVYERLITLRYAAMEKLTRKDNDDQSKKEPFRIHIHPGQTSLIDAIEEVSAEEEPIIREEQGSIFSQEEFETFQPEPEEEIAVEEEPEIEEALTEETIEEEEIVAEQPVFEPAFEEPVSEDTQEDEVTEAVEEVEEVLETEEAEEEAIEEEIVEEKISEEEEASEPEEEVQEPVQVSVTEEEPQSLADKLSRTPIADLRQAIGLNQKFQIIKVYFDGDASMYDDAIDRINGASNLDAALEILNQTAPAFTESEEEELHDDLQDLIERRFL